MHDPCCLRAGLRVCGGDMHPVEKIAHLNWRRLGFGLWLWGGIQWDDCCYFLEGFG